MSKEVLMKYDVSADNYHYGKPFVYYKDGDLYLEHFKVLDRDKESVLRAVKEYVNPNKTQQDYYYNDLLKTKEIDNAYDYWLRSFNYQAIGGGLILWWDIQENWNNELARRGEHCCPKCGTKTVMYYVPFCPKCDDIEIYKGAVNLFQLCYKLAYKFGDDYTNYKNAIFDICDEGSNDSAWNVSMPKNPSIYLKRINDEYPLKDNLFWVSW